MNIQEIVTAVGTLGFPIVMCLLMWKQQKDNNSLVMEHLNKQNKAMQMSLDKNTEATTKNCEAVTRLHDRLAQSA